MYQQHTTKNQSFVNASHFLSTSGLNTYYKFPLLLLDEQLDGVDPYDENLTLDQKERILRECRANIWYFIREVVRIPLGDNKFDMFEINQLTLPIFIATHMRTKSTIIPSRTAGLSTALLLIALQQGLVHPQNKIIADALPEYLKDQLLKKE